MIYKFNNLLSLPNCTHGITKKTANKPQKFSLAMHTGEDIGVSFSNRLKAINMLDISQNTKIILASQTHSSNVVIVDEMDSRGWESMSDAIANCDALISSVSGVVIGVMTADCVPILLFDNEKKVVAAVHAGWKGTKANIVAESVKIMRENFGCDNIIAGIGPSICKCCYEVDEKLANDFSSLYDNSVTIVDGKYMLDLQLINRLQLINAGVKDENIELSNICTACENDSYFSYRKEGGCSGRFGSFIGVRD
jgi:hypothetical protein